MILDVALAVDGGRLRSEVSPPGGGGCPIQRLPVLDMIETSERTRRVLAASVWAIIPPIDAPTTWAGSIPSRVKSPTASSAMSLSV